MKEFYYDAVSALNQCQLLVKTCVMQIVLSFRRVQRYRYGQVYYAQMDDPDFFN